jgi:hypothetical protein
LMRSLRDKFREDCCAILKRHSEKEKKNNNFRRKAAFKLSKLGIWN